jgi:hypothetical protein
VTEGRAARHRIKHRSEIIRREIQRLWSFPQRREAAGDPRNGRAAEFVSSHLSLDFVNALDFVDMASGNEFLLRGFEIEMQAGNCFRWNLCNRDLFSEKIVENASGDHVLFDVAHEGVLTVFRQSYNI